MNSKHRTHSGYIKQRKEMYHTEQGQKNFSPRSHAGTDVQIKLKHGKWWEGLSVAIDTISADKDKKKKSQSQKLIPFCE